VSEKFYNQRFTFCHLANVPLSLPCFALKRVGNPVERFRGLCRWHDQLVSLGKLVERQLVDNGFMSRSQNLFAGASFKYKSFDRYGVVTQLS
jgi:hypothetical protein